MVITTSEVGVWTEWPEAKFFLLFLRIVSNSPAWPGPRRLSNAVVSALCCSAEGSVGMLRLLMLGAHDVCGRQADTQDVCCRLEKDVCGKLTQTSLLNALPACSTAVAIAVVCAERLLKSPVVVDGTVVVVHALI